MTADMSPAMQAVLDRLLVDVEQLFGGARVSLTPAHRCESDTSEVLRLAVSGAATLDAIYVKRVKPVGAGIEASRARVVREFESTSRLHESFARFPSYHVPGPLACYPDALAIVTTAARGETLLSRLERVASWWPGPSRQRELSRALAAVGGWLRALAETEPAPGTFSLDEMRQYIDVRLRRLLETRPPQLDDSRRTAVLRYVDRTSGLVDRDDLRPVFTHADLAPSNVLVSGDDVTVIDFAMAVPGGRYMDLARLYTQLEFLKAKPCFRPAVVARLQGALLTGYDRQLSPDRPLFRLFVLQHLLCHMSNLARNPAPLLPRLYNRHQLLLRRRWLQSFAA